MVRVSQTASADLMDFGGIEVASGSRGAAEAETGIESKYLDW
jgi:hypothetical protein